MNPFLIIGILGTIGILMTAGYLIAPYVLKYVRKVSLKRQRRRFEREALKEQYKVPEPFMFDEIWN